jgi:hypothetical protein
VFVAPLGNAVLGKIGDGAENVAHGGIFSRRLLFQFFDLPANRLVLLDQVGRVFLVFLAARNLFRVLVALGLKRLHVKDRLAAAAVQGAKILQHLVGVQPALAQLAGDEFQMVTNKS